jgi:PAS domain-containing protein
MAHPDEIADLIVSKYSQAKPREFYLFEAQRMAELFRTDLIEIGYLNPDRWRHIADTYADIGLLPRDFPLDGFLYAVDSRSDRSWLYLVGALLVAISAVTVHTLRTNRRLARTLADKKAVHQALRESEERHRLLGDNVIDVIWTMDTSPTSAPRSRSFAATPVPKS